MNHYAILIKNPGEGTSVIRYKTLPEYRLALSAYIKLSDDYNQEDETGTIKTSSHTVEFEGMIVGDGQEVQFQAILATDKVAGLPIRVEAYYDYATKSMELHKVEVPATTYKGCDITNSIKNWATLGIKAAAEDQLFEQWANGGHQVSTPNL